jgi:hypothetical protein
VPQEIHFNDPDMYKFFGKSQKLKLPAVIDQLQEFRRQGLRMHYWP